MFQNALFPQECSRNALLECSRNALFLGFRKIWFQECTFPTGMLQECTFGMLQKCTGMLQECTLGMLQICTFPRKSAFLAEMLQKRTFCEECSRNALLDCTFGMLQKCTVPRKSAFFAEILLPGMLQKRTFFGGMLQECTFGMHFWNAPKMHFS